MTALDFDVDDGDTIRVSMPGYDALPGICAALPQGPCSLLEPSESMRRGWDAGIEREGAGSDARCHRTLSSGPER